MREVDILLGSVILAVLFAVILGGIVEAIV
jgi:hypothetical protein